LAAFLWEISSGIRPSGYVKKVPGVPHARPRNTTASARPLLSTWDADGRRSGQLAKPSAHCRPNRTENRRRVGAERSIIGRLPPRSPRENRRERRGHPVPGGRVLRLACPVPVRHPPNALSLRGFPFDLEVTREGREPCRRLWCPEAPQPIDAELRAHPFTQAGITSSIRGLTTSGRGRAPVFQARDSPSTIRSAPRPPSASRVASRRRTSEPGGLGRVELLNQFSLEKLPRFRRGHR
jgi:hypothetical protein